jgi:hypothetical protein
MILPILSISLVPATLPIVSRLASICHFVRSLKFHDSEMIVSIGRLQINAISISTHAINLTFHKNTKIQVKYLSESFTTHRKINIKNANFRISEVQNDNLYQNDIPKIKCFKFRKTNSINVIPIIYKHYTAVDNILYLQILRFEF